MTNLDLAFALMLGTISIFYIGLGVWVLRKKRIEKATIREEIRKEFDEKYAAHFNSLSDSLDLFVEENTALRTALKRRTHELEEARKAIATP